MALSVFISIGLIHLLAAVSPGPTFVLCLRTAATEGFGTAAMLSIGYGLGAMLWAAGAMAGLALLFELIPVLFVGLKVIGGLFLIYLAHLMFRNAKTPMPDVRTDAPRSRTAAIRMGFLAFATNPKPAVFFGAVFVGLLPNDATVLSRVLLVALIGANEILWYLTVARVFSLPKPRALYARVKTSVDRVFGTLIAVFGLKIALT
ncbi:LysE family translocator [Pelagimonas varians]|uniref:Threonine efflux protein n=1 Tax=Pelagimonas varians TaxID=696760 RepID=A0A238K7M9_9RHOB|nr:LysE family transporter [Pelagimonas varians]PYG31870.1 threonine/homoserine/homoserine lactone efflux protein [Pelagimonas varians]SMX38487.1 Threonine efflux protein [Pelagimonas varians]